MRTPRSEISNRASSGGDLARSAIVIAAIITTIAKKKSPRRMLVMATEIVTIPSAQYQSPPRTMCSCSYALQRKTTCWSGIRVHKLYHYLTAEEVGFEPTRPCGLAVFKTAGMNHYPTPPDSTV